VQERDPAHPNRLDANHPYTSEDVALLRALCLPPPLHLDDMLAMQQQGREAALLQAVEVLAPHCPVRPLDGGASVAVDIRKAR
jgi:hypothetical protein